MKKKEVEEQQIKRVKATQSDKDKGNKKKEVKEKTSKTVKAKQNGTGKGKEKKVEESYLIEKLVNDKTMNGIWKIEVKWKEYKQTTWEPISSLKKEQPGMVKEYMQQINKKTAGKTGSTTPKKRKNKRMSTSLH